MRIVFLRGTVPPKHEHPEKLRYNTIDECEDQWTQLYYHLCKEFDAGGELLYQYGHDAPFPFKKRIEGRIWEKHVPYFKSYTPKIAPDIIMARGGFPDYDHFIKRYPNAFKIYYGAGVRYYPKTKYTDYDLFLVDSHKQFEDIKAKGKRPKMLIKPAASMFEPKKVTKEYDVCFMANATQHVIKRHQFFLETFKDSGLKILALGNTDKKFINFARKNNMNVTWGGWSLRKHLPDKISRCKVGVVCCTSYDSCPRVIPEQLACGVPIVATEGINFWHEKYVNEKHRTGMIVPDCQLLSATNDLISKKWNPSGYYNSQLSLPVAARDLAKSIGKLI